MSHGCAQGENGELLDTSKITWYNDADNDHPMPPSSAMATRGSSVTTLDREPSAMTLERFFKNATPVKKVAGACRSAHIPHPSTKVTDPKNTMALKCKNSCGAAENPCARWIVISLDDGQNTAGEEDNEKTEPDEMKTESVNSGTEDNNDDAYEHTKALGDADCEVYFVFPTLVSLTLCLHRQCI